MNKAPLKGMKDFLPEEMRVRDYVQGKILEIYRASGFERISTPILEDMENLEPFGCSPKGLFRHGRSAPLLSCFFHMEGEVPTEIVISARERRSTPGTMYSPSPHGKTARRTAAPDRHDLFTFHRFHCSRSSWTGAFSYGCATSRRDFPITKFFSCRINGKDFKRRTIHPEPDIASGKGKSVNPFGIILIGRARIKGQNLTQRLPFACGKSLQDFPRGTHLKPGFRLRSRKTACRLRDTVGVGKVGFYIQNRRSVQQVGPRNP